MLARSVAAAISQQGAVGVAGAKTEAGRLAQQLEVVAVAGV